MNYITTCERPSVTHEDLENILTVAALAQSTLIECKYQLNKIDNVLGTNKTPGDIDDMINALDNAINAIDNTYSPRI